VFPANPGCALRDRKTGSSDAPNGGGHKDVEPALGTLEDFDWLQQEIRARGMEVALDFAINCSPDHPYVHEHPDWFYKRPDGTIKYAENPPKKYEDIYPLNFRCEDWRALWDEMVSIIIFWAERGVRIIRVDNPHTKPVPFWEYMIARVHDRFPDVVFLSEAFTKPKMMKALAKAGFTQSYTYFTWRNTKAEVRRILHGAHADGNAGLFPRQSVAEHAGYSAVPPADRRPAGVHDARSVSGDAVECLRHLQRLRAL
jgi:glycosidase